jgi:hypothetical protein
MYKGLQPNGGAGVSSPLSYLDEGSELPTDRLELYFLLKRAIKHTILIAHETVLTKEGVRDAAVVLARCSRRLSIVAQALADAEVVESEKAKGATVS